jgi:manganese transport protein
LITRGAAITPAIILIAIRGDGGVNDLLNLSQVVLAIQLPLAMFPLLWFTSSKRLMGAHRNGWFLLATGWTSAILITALDIYGLPDAMHDAMAVFARH